MKLNSYRIRTWVFAGVVAMLTGILAVSASAQLEWVKGRFSLMGLDGPVSASVIYDDGTGPALYVAGHFQVAGGAKALNIAKWNGSCWLPLGSGIEGDILALAVFNDGTGPALYAGGEFAAAGGVAASNIARWNGKTWSAVGTGLPGPVNMLLVHNESYSRPALFAGGAFGAFGSVAYWHRGSWTHIVGTETIGEVTALATYNDRLYIASLLSVPKLHTWGSSGLAAVSIPYSGLVHEMTSFDDGTGPSLYIAGSISGTGLRGVVKHDGATWSNLGGGIVGSVRSMAVCDDGTGPALYAAGDFRTAGGVAASDIAKWNGSQWSPVGSGVKGAVSTLEVYDDGTGPALYAAGSFRKSGADDTGNVAKWTEGKWSALADGLTGPVYVSQSFYVGGVGGIYQINTSRGSWSRLARVESEHGLPFVAAIAGANRMVIGGHFDSVEGVPAKNVALWDGAFWHPLGEGVSEAVYALLYVDSAQTIAAGSFTTAGGAPANRVAKWDGSSWTTMGDGFNGDVFALCSYGSTILAGGAFTESGSTAVNHIASWSGTGWSEFAGGLPGEVRSIATRYGHWDVLYSGGPSHTEAGEPVSPLNRLQGSSWVSVKGLDTPCRVDSLSVNVYDPWDLLVGGLFHSTGANPLRCIGRWNPNGWSSVGGGTDDLAGVSAVWLDRFGPVVVGGDFASVGGSVSPGLAVWSHMEPTYSAAVATAKSQVDGTKISLPSVVCTANFGDMFYVEQPNRACGMQVLMPGNGLFPDTAVTLTGRMRTSVQGERYLEAWSAVSDGSASLRPLLVTAKWLGGGKLGLQSATSGWRWSETGPTWGDASGLNNIGLLVRICGQVVETGDHWFTVDDGSGVSVKCILPWLAAVPMPGETVSVTGVCSCEKKTSGLHPIIRVRSPDDVTQI